MADNDILFGFAEKQPDGSFRLSRKKTSVEASVILRNIMPSFGYSAENTSEKDDIYNKDPIYNFEMHKLLVSSDEDFFSYYEDPWKRAISLGNFNFCFSPEDEYIYNLTHMYKHFYSAGCGIRHIVDLYVMIRHDGENMDNLYIEHELKTLGLSSFNYTMVSFINEVFSVNQELSDDNRELLLFITGCGTFGNLSGIIHNRMKKASIEVEENKKKAKILYIIRRIFPSLFILIPYWKRIVFQIWKYFRRISICTSKKIKGKLMRFLHNVCLFFHFITTHAL